MTAGAVGAAPVTRSSSEHRALPGAVLVSAATAASGVLTYAFLIVAARALGPAEYGRIGVLWAAMFIAAIVLFRPLEQTASQAIAARTARADASAAVVRSVAGSAVALALAVVAASAIGWGALRDGLFDGSSLLTALLAAGTVLYGASYVVRGIVGGLRWFHGYSLALLADSAGRLLIALPLLLAHSAAVAAVAVAAAGACGAIAPVVSGRGRLGARLRAGTPAPYRLGSAAAFAAPAAVVAACDQIVVNGPPLLARLDGASAHVVGLVFAATMLLRAPVYVFQGLAASLLPNFTHLSEGAGRLRAQVVRLVAGLAVVGLAMVTGTALAGPRVMRLLYGDRYAVSRESLVLLAVAVTAYLVAATLSQALLALQRGWQAASIWLIVVAVFVAAFALLPGAELARVAAALAVAVALGALLLGARVAHLVTT